MNRRSLLSFLILFLAVSPAWAQIAFDAASSGSTTSAGTTLSFDHTATGSELLLVVGVSYEGSGNSVSDITYNSVSLTQVRQDTNSFTNSHNDLWYLKAPASGTNSVAITITNSSTRIIAGSISFTGADQDSPLDAQAGASGGPGKDVVNSVTTGVANTQIVSVVSFGDGTTASSTDLTERWEIDEAANPAGAGGNRSAGAAGSYGADWTLVANRRWVTSAASFKPVASARRLMVISANYPSEHLVVVQPERLHRERAGGRK